MKKKDPTKNDAKMIATQQQIKKDYQSEVLTKRLQKHTEVKA